MEDNGNNNRGWSLSRHDSSGVDFSCSWKIIPFQPMVVVSDARSKLSVTHGIVLHEGKPKRMIRYANSVCG